jgi:hypothetical protein
MSTRFATIDLTQLAPPQVIDNLDYITVMQSRLDNPSRSRSCARRTPTANCSCAARSTTSARRVITVAVGFRIPNGTPFRLTPPESQLNTSADKTPFQG